MAAVQTDWAVQLRERSNVQNSPCDHLLAITELNESVLSEGMRFSHPACRCAPLKYRLCLTCGAKLCSEHSLLFHALSTQHWICLNICMLTSSCISCGKDNMDPPVENIAEMLNIPLQATGLRGLENTGNICFMNAVWQALSNTTDFRKKLSVENQPNVISTEQSSLYTSFISLLARLWTTNPENKIDTKNQRPYSPPLDPSELFQLIKVNMPIFGDAAQHDAHEFLRFFSDNLHAVHATSTQVFGGSLLSEVTCLGCQQVARKVDPILDISLDFPPDLKLTVKVNDTGSAEGCRPLRLHDCLQHFSRVESLERGNDDACKRCTESLRSVSVSSSSPTQDVVASKRLRFLDMPEVLVIHFKRFRWSFYASNVKISRYVQFPLRGLRLDEFRAADVLGNDLPKSQAGALVYDLASVVVHHGRAMGNGHYTAYCLNNNDKRWYHYNDNVVSAVDEEVVSRAEAYILFYERRKESDLNLDGVVRLHT